MKHYKAFGTFTGFEQTLFTEVEKLENKWVAEKVDVTFEGKAMKIIFDYNNQNYEVLGKLNKETYVADIVCNHHHSGKLNASIFKNDKGFVITGAWEEGFMKNEIWGLFEWVGKKRSLHSKMTK